MSDTNFRLGAESDLDDLPRTLRREHEARARKARERETRSRGETLSVDAPSYDSADDSYAGHRDAGNAIPASVTRIDVPFGRLVLFFLKAVIAAIPALILLGVILWFMGHLLQTLYPELIKMKILIAFPGWERVMIGLLAAEIIGALISSLFLVNLAIALAGVRFSRVRQIAVAYSVFAVFAIFVNAVGAADGGPPNFDRSAVYVLGSFIGFLAQVVMLWGGAPTRHPPQDPPPLPR